MKLKTINMYLKDGMGSTAIVKELEVRVIQLTSCFGLRNIEIC